MKRRFHCTQNISQKNYVKRFGVCSLTEQDRAKLIDLNDQNEIDDFLMLQYKIQINDIE